jgi:rhamnose utilization protein RhaD (predicted bifunctional aldolase and dehydrogenase)
MSHELAAFSAAIGTNPLVIQGPGGNTSLKQDGVMWIKASGTCLADADTRDIFLPVTLAQLRAAIAADDPACETSAGFVPQDLNPLGLRPSIETTMHAVMPQRVVVHVHCVDTIAWAVQQDAETLLAALLAGLDWTFVPYARPGLPLTRAILARLQPSTCVLVLGNHGLVVAADTVAAAEQLLNEVRRRLRRPARSVPEADTERLARLARASGYRPADAAVHALATDPVSLAIARGRSLYPDHVIFLGPGVVVLEEDAAVTNAPPSVPLLLVPGLGALLHHTASASAVSLARCLADVTARLETHEILHRLTEADERALLDWDAEKYRQALALRGQS